MSSLKDAGRFSFLFAVAGAAVFWTALSLSIYLHPGFDLFSPHQALSDLGKIGATYPYVFNLGIISTGVLYMIAILCLLNTSLKKLERISFTAFFVALVAYIGIGLFPKGTALHIPMTLSFYLLASIAIFTWCAELFRERRYPLPGIFIFLVISGYVIFGFYKYVGYPFAELYGGTIIMAWVLTVTKITQQKKEN
ncbi:MAG: DUF998 domain-containing protein [Euryarchaeota archaeon]|nr:DUF998 domain-containing protein [Euryarchaeota archaeon]